MDLKEALLSYYNLSTDDYLKLAKPIEEVKLLDPLSIEIMPKIVSRIKQAIANKEKIIVYGDYDCDGISAITIIVRTFKLLNYPIAYYVPSRYLDGYGLNVTNVEKIAKEGYSLILTVDNGISAFEAIDLANQHNIDVIVIDHHDLPETDVNAYAILHPIHSKVSDIVASGGYMSLFLSAALLGYYDRYLVTIAGLSVISDLMELKGYNRDVVRLAIEYLNKYYFEELTLLVENQDNFTERSFGLDIAPKINSVGRFITDTKVNRIIKYLTTDNKEERLLLRDWILDVNEKRKEETKNAVLSYDVTNLADEGIVLKTDMLEGLIGLVANKILNEVNKPACVFTRDSKDEAIIKGSMRSKDGFSVSEFLKLNQDILITGGGHALAGGLSILEKDYLLFKSRFIYYAKNHPFIEEEVDAISISLGDVTMENYKIIRSFAPFGMGFKEPDFIIKDIPTRALKFSRDGKHLLTPLGISSKLIGFNFPEEDIKKLPAIDLVGNFASSSFRGQLTVEFRVKRIIERYK